MSMRTILTVITIHTALAFAGACPADTPASAAEAERWLENFEEEIPPAPQVSEGELLFFADPPDTHIHHLHNRLTIDERSLETGFVALLQCHRNLDAVPDAEITYRYRRILDLRILSHRNIGMARVADQSVQLKEVGHDAELCVEAQVAVLYPAGGRRYVLRNGPFHRRFLDGYFPMRVTIHILYPEDMLELVGVSPAPQPGFSVATSPGKANIDAWFAGMLNLEVEFGLLDEGKAR